MRTTTGVRTVKIPAFEMHEGFIGNVVAIRLNWTCPTCGGERGEIYDTISYDGSRRLNVDGWKNPCGHIDKYSQVRIEAKNNGLNVAVCEICGGTEKYPNGLCAICSTEKEQRAA